MGQTEVKTDGVVALLAVFAQRLRRGLAQEFPVRVPGEAVLGQCRCVMVLWGWTEDLLTWSVSKSFYRGRQGG